MKVLFINDSTSNPNWGDRAAVISLKHMITQTGATIAGTLSEDDLRWSRFRDAPNGSEAPRISHALEAGLKLFVPPVLLKLRERLWSRLGSFSDRDTDIVPTHWEQFDQRAAMLLANRTQHSQLLHAIQESDVLVIHGNGCMVGNTRIARAELFLTYIAKRHFHKPVIIVNHTAEFTHPDLLRIAQHVYPLFDDVVFRDPISAQRNKLLCDGRFAPDSAFLFTPAPVSQWLSIARRPTYFDVWPDAAAFDPAKPYLCLGGSSIFSFSFGTEPVELISNLVALIEGVQSVYSGQIVLTASDLKDEYLLRPIARRLDLPLVALTLPVQQAVDILGNAQAYIGGRWHPSIFALRGGVPVVPLSSKTFKMQALVEAAGLSTPIFDALNLAGERTAIARQLCNCLEQGHALRSHLRAWGEETARHCWDNVRYLKTCSSHASTHRP